MNTLKKQVFEILYKNKEKTISGNYLSKQLKLSKVEIRNLIKSLRNDGHTIIAGNSGYKLTHNIKLINEYIENRMIEIQSEIDTLNAMKIK